MAGVRMTHRRSGSVVRVPQAKAESVSLADLGFRADEPSKPAAKKAPAKKATAKKASASKSTK